MSSTIPRGQVARMFCVSGDLDPGAVSAATSSEQNVPVTGVKVGDFVFAEKPSVTAGIVVGSCRVNQDGNIKVTLANVTAGSLNPASETWRFMVFRPENLATLNGTITV